LLPDQLLDDLVLEATSPLTASRLSALAKNCASTPTRSVAAHSRLTEASSICSPSFAFVLNATDPEWKKGIQSALAVLKKLGPVIPKSIRQRTVYASALTTGKTGPERDKTAADEISALWASVKKLATAKASAK
jgi:hypothetical protein